MYVNLNKRKKMGMKTSGSAFSLAPMNGIKRVATKMKVNQMLQLLIFPIEYESLSKEPLTISMASFRVVVVCPSLSISHSRLQFSVGRFQLLTWSLDFYDVVT